MEVEHVTRIGFTTGWSTNQKGDGTVGHGVFGQIIIDDQHVFPLVHKVFAHGTASVGGDILHGSQFGSRSGDNDGVVHSTCIFQCADNLGNGGTFLTDGNVDADDILTLLVDDGIQCYSGFASLAVTDNQFPLTTANGNHGVDGLDASLERNGNGFPFNDARGRGFNGVIVFSFNGPFAVNGIAQGIHNTTD